MIASLRGTLTRKEPGRLVVETAGVGYLLQVPLGTFFSAPDPGASIALLVHTHVRDDAIQLFGFATELELATFEILIGVSGIGPRMAVTILSGIPAEDLTRAIRAGDVRRLTAVPGLGKKTSERLVLELRDKVDGLPIGSAPVARRAPIDDLRDDAVSALVNLGYRRAEAEKAVGQVEPAGDLESLLRAALTALAR